MASQTNALVRELSNEKLAEIQKEAQDWAGCNGLVMYNRNGSLTHAPFTLLPTPISRKAFQDVWNLGPDFNYLVHQISKDKEFLLKTLGSMAEDSFTTSLIEIFKKVNEEGVRQKISLGIHRSDYMVHSPSEDVPPQLKQVELNTIAASFSNLSAIASNLHRYLIHRVNLPYEDKSIPQNDTREEIPAALAKATELYNHQGSVVMMIVHPGETNSFDQRWFEYILWQKYQIRLIRRSLADVAERGRMDEAGHLHIDGHVVAVSYYRAGYTPDDYPTDKEWEGRLLIERSMSIKCPSIAYHLVGAKKVQQVLANEGVLEKFTVDAAQAARLRACFIGLYTLDAAEDPKVPAFLQQVKANPFHYVMKPQREGGGNNLYNEQIVQALNTFSPQKIATYIMMDRIMVPSVSTYMLREGKVIAAEGVAELGIFSVYISDGEEKEVLNKSAGYLLRTKIAKVDDGGVAAGVAVLDVPYLID